MYECPSCSAGLSFNPKTQKLECKYCHSQYETKELEEKKGKDAKGEKDVVFNADKGGSMYEAIVYRCTQCGAELITTDETIATFCSYCGSSAVLERKNTKKAKPDYVIPFTKTKEECERAYKNKLKKSIFAPKNMIEDQQIEKIRGIYMPYWIYSFKKNGTVISKGEKYAGRHGNYVYYDEYNLTTKVNARYSGISHDATSNFADDLSEAIAPFNVKERKEFNTTYLSGFYADSEDIPQNVYTEDCNEVASKQASAELKKKNRTYSSYSSNPRVILDQESVELGLFPVYFLATRNKTGDRVSYAVVNGQTGKVAAEIPIDIKKFVITSLILAIPIFLLLNIGFTLTPIKVISVSIIFNILSILTSVFQLGKIDKREKRLDDKGYVSKNQEKNKGKKSKIKGHINIKQFVKPVIGLIISLVVCFLHPVNDIYYYIGAVVSIVMTLLSFIDIIKGINLLTTRKLPQLEKRGGDENA